MEILEFIKYLLFGSGDIHCAFLPIVLAGIALASTAIGAAQSAKANRDNEKELEKQRKLSDNEYLREYYNGLDSTENRAYLKRLDSRMKKVDAAAENSSVATNATHENALATKQRNNEVYNNAVADIVARNERNKNNAQNQYYNRQYGLASQQMALNNQSAQTWMNAASGIASAATSLGMAYAMDGGSLFGGKVGSGSAPEFTKSSIPKLTPSSGGYGVLNLPRPF